MGTTYLIDFENVGNRWADMLSGRAAAGDEAILFYSDNSPKAMLDQLEKMERAGVAIRFRHCVAGRNGLDFQLSSELGWQACSDPGREYAILSGDAGFGVLPGYWAAAGVKVRVIDGPERAGSHDIGSSVAARLDGPMTEAGLSRADRGHVLGCAKACMAGLQGAGDRMAKFREDTLRIKGRACMDRLERDLGPALKALFGSP